MLAVGAFAVGPLVGEGRFELAVDVLCGAVVAADADADLGEGVLVESAQVLGPAVAIGFFVAVTSSVVIPVGVRIGSLGVFAGERAQCGCVPGDGVCLGWADPAVFGGVEGARSDRLVDTVACEDLVEIRGDFKDRELGVADAPRRQHGPSLRDIRAGRAPLLGFRPSGVGKTSDRPRGQTRKGTLGWMVL